MSIPTQMSLVGFVASAPELHFTRQGAECCRLRVGVEQWRMEVDGGTAARTGDRLKWGSVATFAPIDRLDSRDDSRTNFHRLWNASSIWVASA